MTGRPKTTLFMLMSVDGKISSGAGDLLDADRDWSLIPGVMEGIHQYYEIEQTTDLWSLNTGRVMEKIGVNQQYDVPKKMACSFVILDNRPHLTSRGIEYLCGWVNQLIIITSNRSHPAFSAGYENLHIIFQKTVDLEKALRILAADYQVKEITIQSGGTLNGEFLRRGLFDKLDLIVAPLLVGGRDTPTLIDGNSIVSPAQLGLLGRLKLCGCTVLEDSYLRLQYDVMRE